MGDDVSASAKRPPIYVELQEGALGSVWPIRPMPFRNVLADADPWTVQMVPGIPAAFLFCHKPEKRLGPKEHRRKAERILDALSWEGGGHYELVPLDGTNEHMLWDWTGPTPRAQISVALEQKLPFSIRSQPANDQATQGHRTKYSPALRYYRCAQTASNPVAAFQNLYLAFEFVAAERIPIRSDESERVWLKRVIHELVAQNPKDVLEELEPKAKGDWFYRQVYEAARCTTFHAKPQKGPVAPYDEKEEDVRRAYELLIPHVIELLRSATGWPEGHRVVGEKEMAQTGQTLLELERAGFQLNRKENPNSDRPVAHAWTEGQVPRTYWISSRVDAELARAITGMKWKLGPVLATHAFQVFPQASQEMDVVVRLVVAARFDGLIRSPASPLDFIAPIRTRPKRSREEYKLRGTRDTTRPDAS